MISYNYIRQPEVGVHPPSSGGKHAQIGCPFIEHTAQISPAGQSLGGAGTPPVIFFISDLLSFLNFSIKLI